MGISLILYVLHARTFVRKRTLGQGRFKGGLLGYSTEKQAAPGLQDSVLIQGDVPPGGRKDKLPKTLTSEHLLSVLKMPLLTCRPSTVWVKVVPGRSWICW